MLSVFLRAGSHTPKCPVHQNISGDEYGSDGETKLHGNVDPMAVQAEAPRAPADSATGNLPGLLSVIIANAEFLEVVYGENRHLKNILDAAGKAKRQFRDG